MSGQSLAAELVAKPAESADPKPLARLTSTALSPNDSSVSAEITHPFHPLRGQRFEVLKERCVSGVDTLILRDTQRGSFAVSRLWTDLALPNSSHQRVDGPPGRLDLWSLCDLVDLLELFSSRKSKGVAK
jgi:hypothetical protein